MLHAQSCSCVLVSLAVHGVCVYEHAVRWHWRVWLQLKHCIAGVCGQCVHLQHWVCCATRLLSQYHPRSSRGCKGWGASPHVQLALGVLRLLVLAVVTGSGVLLATSSCFVGPNQPCRAQRCALPTGQFAGVITCRKHMFAARTTMLRCATATGAALCC